MLHGIDISNNNKGLNLTDTSLLYIMKATQGTSFVDRYCDPWVQWCIANGVPWGFYHFMSKNYGVAEAEFFYRNTRNYFTHGVPILDFEQDGLTDEEAESFVWRIHELSGIVRHVIPGFRISDEAIDHDVELCSVYGATFKTGVEVTNARDLLDQGFTDVVVAVQSAQPSDTNVKLWIQI